jgi:hypothetical protein
MNQRIKQLAWQVGITIVEQPFDDATQSWNDSMEKFAKLIIEECAQVAFAKAPSDESACEISQAINEHFGVEE